MIVDVLIYENEKDFIRLTIGDYPEALLLGWGAGVCVYSSQVCFDIELLETTVLSDICSLVDESLTNNSITKVQCGIVKKAIKQYTKTSER